MSAAWIAVIASLGGVALGGLLNVLADTLRWRREDRQTAVARTQEREERTQQLCIDLASVADEMMSLIHNFVDFQEENPKGWRTDPFVQDQLVKLEAAWSAFTRTYNALRIAGMNPSMRTGAIARIREAADNLYDFIGAAFSGAYPPDPEIPSADEWSKVGNDFLDLVATEVGTLKPTRQLRLPPPVPRTLVLPRSIPRTPPRRR